MKLTDAQLERLSEFTANLGLVFIVSVVTPLFTDFEKTNLYNVSFGVIATFACLIISLYLEKGVNYEH